MKTYLTAMMRPALFILAAMLVLPAFAADENATGKVDDSAVSKTDDSAGSSGMETLGERLAADKRKIVANNMHLTDAEAKGFWPIYDAYQTDLQKINVRIAKVINEFALEYNKGAMLNGTAKKLLDESIAIEQAEVKLKQSYLPKLGKVLPAVKVARYIQIENKIRAVIRYKLAEGIPLAE